jgi:hypothetical protein
MGAKSPEAHAGTGQGSTAPGASSAPVAGGALAAADVGASVELAQVGGETVSPDAFPAAPRGPSAVAAMRRYGAEVTYTLNVASGVRFTVAKVESGRTSSGRCVGLTKANHDARRCTRLVALPGSFTRAGSAGVDRFDFSGRLGGRELAIGSYRLIARPVAVGAGGHATTVAFRVVK